MGSMTEEYFNEWFHVDVPCALFHVESTTLDDSTGIKLDELILIEMIASEPEVLKFKSLGFLVNHFITQFEENE